MKKITLASLAALAASALITGCASQASNSSAPASQPAASSQPSSENKPAVVSKKSAEGEVFGEIRPNSKFAKIKLGMRMRQVNSLIGAPDDMLRHETGKRWIPFYFGDDAQRIQVLYKGEGCLTYTGGNIYGGAGDDLIKIEADPKGACFDS